VHEVGVEKWLVSAVMGMYDDDARTGCVE